MSEPLAPLIVSSESAASDDPYDVILSNIEVVNDLATLLGPDELAPEALISYYTDFYHAQMDNGGFAQFAFNSECSPLILECVSAGLEAFDAPRHAEVFARARAILDSLPGTEIEDFLESDLFAESHPLRDLLNGAAAGFDEAEGDLVLRNAAYLMSRPSLLTVPEAELEQAIEAVFAGLPDRAEREAELDEAPQPEFVQVILGLVERAGLTLDRITAGSPSPDGIVWHFLTEQGAHHYVLQGDDAVLFADEDDSEVLRVPVAELVTEPVG